MIKTAPNRHTDHASERETHIEKGNPDIQTSHTLTHTLTPSAINHSLLPVHSDIGLSCKHRQTGFVVFHFLWKDSIQKVIKSGLKS